MNLRDFLESRISTDVLYNSQINEAVNSKYIQSTLKIIGSYLNKRNIYILEALPLQIVKDNQILTAILAWTPENNNLGCFYWEIGNSAEVHSVGFVSEWGRVFSAFLNKDTSKIKWDIDVACKGASITRVCQLVEKVMLGKIRMDISSVVKEIEDAQLFESYDDIMEDVQDDINALKKERMKIYMKIRYMKNRGADIKDIEELEDQFHKAKSRLSDARKRARAGVTTTIKTTPEIDKLENKFEAQVKATPGERFEDMTSYINMVIQGYKPLAVICGAPGVGKTYRITQEIKANGLEFGRDWYLIKGKCTPSELYVKMHDYQGEGQLIVLDDADEIVKDPVAINLIKAATDSSDMRIVSYGTSRSPIMSSDIQDKWGDGEIDKDGNLRYPKQFEMKSSMIIITNMRAGQIDTAIKNRAYLCDLNFNIQEVLDIVKSLMPKIQPDKLSNEAKQKSYEYLVDLAKRDVPMEISIRSFTLVASLYQCAITSGAPESAVQRRIVEQMTLQFQRGGRKY